MFINTVVIENIRSYIHGTLIFPEGITLLAGDIGSGKSTILLAIEFALFGMRGKQLSGATLLRNGARTGSVELQCTVNNISYTIKRSLKRAGSGVTQDAGYYIRNGIKTNATAVELKATVLSLLGYPASLLTKSKNIMYTYTVYTPQEDMKQILVDSAENRLDVLRKVFGLDKYKGIRENSTIISKYFREQYLVHIGIAHDKELKSKQLQERRQQFFKVQQEQAELTPIVILADERVQLYQKKVLEWKEKLEQKIQLSQRIALQHLSLQEKEQQLQHYTKEYAVQTEELLLIQKELHVPLECPSTIHPHELEKHIELLSQERQAWSQRMKEVRLRYNHTMTQIEEWTQHTKRVQECSSLLKNKEFMLCQLQEKIRDKELIEAELKNTQETVQQLLIQLKEAEVHISTAKALQQKIQDLDQCPVCLQTVTIDHKQSIRDNEEKTIVTKQEAVTKIHEKFINQKNSLDKLQISVDNYHRRDAELAVLRSEVTALQEQRVVLRERTHSLTLLQQQQATLATELQLCDSLPLQQLAEDIQCHRQLLHAVQLYQKEQQKRQHRQERSVQIDASMKSIQAILLQLQQEKEQGRKNEKDLVAQRDYYRDVEQHLKEVESQLEEAQKILKNHELQQVQLGQECKSLITAVTILQEETELKKNAAKTAQYYKNMRYWLDNFFSPLLSTIEKHILAQVYQRFNELFQQWFSILMEDAIISVHLDTSFTPIIEQNGYETEYTFLSGGERTSCALAYRLALNRVVNDVQSTLQTCDLLILDEPTDGFSTEQLDKLRVVLDELALKQVIIVSHEAKIESFVDTVIRVHKDEHVSRVV